MGATGIKQNPEHTEKVVQTRRERYGDRYMSDEGYTSREKHLKKWASENNPASRKIRCVELDITFNKMKDAADHFGYAYSSFCEALRSGNTFGGYTWEKLDPIINRSYKWKKRVVGNEKPIMCVETGEIFQSAKYLAPTIGVKPRTVSDIVLYNREHDGKHYKYINKGEFEYGSSVAKS